MDTNTTDSNISLESGAYQQYWAHNTIHNCSDLENCVNPLPDDKILDRSKMKRIADDILKCIYNGK